MPTSTEWHIYGLSGNWFEIGGVVATSSGAAPAGTVRRLLITVNGLTFLDEPRR